MIQISNCSQSKICADQSFLHVNNLQEVHLHCVIMHKTLTANKISFLFLPRAFLHYDCFHGADTLLTSRHAQEGLSKPFKAFQRLSYYPAILLLTKFLKVTISRLKCKFSLHFLGKIDCFVQNLFCPYSYLPVS